MELGLTMAFAWTTRAREPAFIRRCRRHDHHRLQLCLQERSTGERLANLYRQLRVSKDGDQVLPWRLSRAILSCLCARRKPYAVRGRHHINMLERGTLPLPDTPPLRRNICVPPVMRANRRLHGVLC